MQQSCHKRTLFFLFFCALSSTAPRALSQSFIEVQKALDTTYIADYHNELIVRGFGSRKYTTYSLQDKGFDEKLRYRPNSPFNVGIGFNYKMIGINLGFNLPIINDSKIYGKTRFLDLQSHVYGRKLIVDLYLQRYKGFYLSGNDWQINNNQIYLRPDLITLNAGVEFQYLMNWSKFTFRGAFLQNEVQLKSAGSPIIGAYLGSITIDADSSVVPQSLIHSNFFNGYKFFHSNVRSATLSVGYGYTFVLPYHFFITLAASGGFGVNNTILQSKLVGSTSTFGTNASGTLRIGMGYNSRRFFSGIHYVGTESGNTTPIAHARQVFGAGNFRVSVAYRFTLKKKLFGFY